MEKGNYFGAGLHLWRVLKAVGIKLQKEDVGCILKTEYGGLRRNQSPCPGDLY